MFLASIFISRYAGKELFGFFSVILGFIVIGMNGATLGLDATMVRFIPQYRTENRADAVAALQRYALFSSFGIALTAGAIIALLLVYNRGYEWPSAIFAGGCLPVAAGVLILQAIMRADRNVIKAVFSEAVIRPIVFLSLLAFFYLYLGSHLDLEAIVGSYFLALIIALITAIILVVYGQHVRCSSFFSNSDREVGRWMGVGFSFLLSSFSIALINQTSVVVSGVVLSAFDAGEFGAALRLAMLAAFALNAVNSVITPFLSRAGASGNHDELQALVTRATAFGLVFAVPVCLGFLVLSSDLLTMFGKNYGASADILRILIIGYGLQAACGPAHSLLAMTGYHYLSAKILAVIASLSVIGIIVSMPFYGLMSGAVITALAVVIYPVIMVAVCRRKLGIDPSILSLSGLFKTSR